jgi:hypothetical protein
MNLSQVSYNLQTLWATQQNQSRLVADHTSTYLYEANTLMGCWYSFVSKGSVDTAKQKTKEAFDRAVQYIEERCKAYPENKSELFAFDAATRFYRKNKLLPFVSPNLDKISTTYRRALKLEIATSEEIPIAIIKKEDPTAKEILELKCWFERAKQKTAIHQLHRGLGALIQDVEDLATFELYVQSNWEKTPLTSIFCQKDDKHLAWARSIRPGSIIDGHIIEGILGESANSENDLNLVFSIQGHPDKVLVVGCNEARLAIKKTLMEHIPWGIQGPVYDSIHPFGKYAICQKLVQATKEELFLPVMRWIQWLIEQDRVPLITRREHLMLDTSGKLRTCKPSPAAPAFWAIRLEKICFDLSEGDLSYFQKMIIDSGLDKHPQIKGFRKIMEERLYTNGSLRERVIATGLCESSCLDEAEQTLKAFQDLFLELKQQFPSKKEKTIKEAMIAAFRESKGSFFLWPGLKGAATLKLL